MKGNYLVVDFETGGVDVKKHPVTQVAMLAVDATDLQEIARFESFIQNYDNLEITKIALEKTMVTMEDVNNGMEVKDFMQGIFPEFCKTAMKGKKKSRTNGLVLVGHNIPFDLAFFKQIAKFSKVDLESLLSHNNGEFLFIDTMQLARIVWGLGLKSDDNNSFTLTACCKRAGIDIFDAHGAMNDVIATWKLLQYFSSLSPDNDNKDIIQEERNRKTFQIPN